MSFIQDLEHAVEVVPKLEEEVARHKAILDQVAALIPAPVGEAVEEVVNVVSEIARAEEPQDTPAAAPAAPAAEEPVKAEEPAAEPEAGNSEQAPGPDHCQTN